MRTKISVAAIATIGIMVAQTSTAEKESSWHHRMDKLANIVGELMPILNQDQPDKKQLKRAQSLTEDLSKIAHSISGSVLKKAKEKIPNPDPSLKIMSKIMEEEIDWVADDLKRGNVGIARERFLGVVHHCFSCHSVGNTGKSFLSDEFDKKLKISDPFDRAEILAATRRYDSALREYQKILSKKSLFKKRRFEWGDALEQALYLSVRVKKDPDLTLDILKQAVRHKPPSRFFNENVKAWRKSTREWKKELGRTFPREEGYFAEGRRLLAKALKAQQYPADTRGLIDFLRASSVFHEQLRLFPQGKRRTKALYFLGQSYDVLNDMGDWSISNQYYEMCVLESPKSNLAKDCYERYEVNIFFGYSGSGGTFVPEDVMDRIKKLRRKAGG